MGSKATKRKHPNFHKFSSALSSAVLEWLLLLLLFINGAFSYLISKFAKRSKLQPPCVLCSSLDHMIGHSGHALYSELLCDSHKMEMSSLAYCCVHRRLSNVHTMCQKCLFSSNNGQHHSLVRTLSIEFGQTDTSEVPLLTEDGDSLHASPISQNCSCCAEPLKEAKGHVFRLVSTMDRDGIELIDAAEIGMNREITLEKDNNHLPHVEYSELKNEDSNSEIHTNDLNDFDISHKIEVGGTEDSLLEPFLNGEEMEVHVPSTNTSTHENILDELQNVEPDEKTEKHLLSELSCEDSTGANLSSTIEKGKSEDNAAPQDGIPSIEESAKDLSSENPYPIPDPIPSPSGSLSLTDASNPYPIPDPIPSPSGSLSLTDAYNLAIRNQATTSPRYEDVITGKDSSRVYEELKLLISQISAARGVDLPWTDISSSPRILQAGEESVLYNITKTLSLERCESMVSMEGSIVSEIEGESTVDRLKRQIDLDRKSISLLYKELEEERNASAIAANQAMAMITRLQEEKAAMQMEGLQYQRVMEEQVDYNQEALQKCNEIISQKEKYIEELEAELAIYREQPGNTEVALDVSDISSLSFGEQKAYISDQLHKLEERLHHFSNNSSFAESPKLDSIEEVDEENFPRENGEVSESVPVKENHSGKRDLVELEEEISRLSKRLKALEADNNFLEHSLNSLKSGREGARFIREIAVSLRDLRDLGITHGK
ncbi:hypothetical protein LUZ62_025509 [Rhynchospora pubera]|uniref:GTD-binding domain-containing protein n=1 Tax=Rhynchospora pubera TaxID=906938 RepID=A0AAV8HDR3_9POAL|nr:hypothetical protein LUZ62_025509 [Rhynchospora pubera]